MNKEYILSGVITKTKGYKGELYILNVPTAIENIKENVTVKIGYSLNFSKDYTLTSFKRYQKGATVRLTEINSDKEGKPLKEKGIFVDVNDINKKENKYIDHELIDCMVIDNKTNQEYGKIIDVMEMPANDVWLMDYNNLEIPIPVIEDVIKKVDIDKKQIFVELIDGLLELGEN
jgi:16S rRNA processing protein RimM